MRMHSVISVSLASIALDMKPQKSGRITTHYSEGDRRPHMGKPFGSKKNRWRARRDSNSRPPGSKDSS